jgi:hypothetical protein
MFFAFFQKGQKHKIPIPEATFFGILANFCNNRKTCVFLVFKAQNYSILAPNSLSRSLALSRFFRENARIRGRGSRTQTTIIPQPRHETDAARAREAGYGIRPAGLAHQGERFGREQTQGSEPTGL